MEMRDDLKGTFREEVFSRSVRAGKRTYFFDVKATQKNEYYLTITESKKCLGEGGNVVYEKHKIFLYKEDFEKFMKGLVTVFEFIKQKQPEIGEINDEDVLLAEYTNIDFEELE
jgi:hypothetical protein